MKSFFILILLSVVPTIAFPNNLNTWNIKSFEYDAKTILVPKVRIRAGYLNAKVDKNQSFQGNILFLQGLADSMLNHAPLFKTLTENGYRVIAFDYMGQGGSTGTMNHTRILSALTPNLEIRKIAEIVWEKFARPEKPKKNIIGWSTGGLAAYEMAHSQWADAVILIAPGICANKSVGESLLHGNKISLRTLTSASSLYEFESNPHIDPIKPISPLVVPMFATNLLHVSKKSQKWLIAKSVDGLILHSGQHDSYVNSACNKAVVTKNASHFSQVEYDNALHEIDNEIPEIQLDAFDEILEFLKN